MATSLLLADDSATIAKILSMALQSEPYEIRSVLTADDAIKELKANPPAYFLVDLTLPGKNGYEFAQMIRADANLAQTRVVLLSSAFDPVDEEKFQACGADGVIVKPFDPAELRSKLRQLGEMPPKFPPGSNVQGALSGQSFSAPAETAPDAPPPAPQAATETPDLLVETSGEEGDANAILSSLLGGTSDADTPPPAPQAAPNGPADPTNPSIQLDLSEGPPPFQAQEAVLDFGAALESATAVIATPPQPSPLPLPESNEDVLGTLLGTKEEPPPKLPPPDAPLSPKAEELSEFFEKELTRNVERPADAPLSKNAEALAAFFSAEIEQKQAIAPAETAKEEDAFDASLGSIEWATPPEESLNAWSSNVPPAPPSQTAPKPVSPARAQAKAKGANAPSGASLGGTPMFDTGGSNFRFAEDYIHRITRSFTGALDESVPARHPTPSAEQTVFPKASNDSAPQAAPSAGGGAWNAEELQKVEQLVREEVQMVVREVVEKVAWEVIPELAENLIKKELEKILKQMES